MAENLGRELSWDDQIENDSEFILLPKGDCDLEIIDFERGRHSGSEKLPPCNKAIVSIKATAKDGKSTIIKHQLFLHSTTEGLLCAFFVGFGLRKHGEKVAMPWNKVVGAKARGEVGIRKYTPTEGANAGREMEFNEIKKFYDPAESSPTITPGKF